MDYSSYSLNSQPNHKERQFLRLIKPILPFLRLSEVARLLFLSKKIVDASFEVSYILMYMIKNYYLDKADIDSETERFFKVLLTERLDQKIASSIVQLGETEAKMIMNAIYKVDEMNLVRFPANLDEKLNGWRITKNGGSGWQLKEKEPVNENKTLLASSYNMCSMEYIVKYKDFSQRFRDSFEKGQAMIKAGTEICRRGDCHARGGFQILFLNKRNKTLLKKECYKESNELSNWKFEKVELNFSVHEIKTVEYLDEATIKFTIYGRDEQFWNGHYGAHFTGMFIRGHYITEGFKEVL